VLHRDLKPGNVMLGKFGETLVVDWGLAKVIGRSRDREGADGSTEQTLRPSSASGSEPTQAGVALGTPEYMSPEQAAGRVNELGPATDIYALGATLYTILTNRLPVEGGDIGEKLRKVQRGEVGINRSTDFADSADESAKPADRVPPPLRAICRKAMAYDPKGRYASALDLAADIENWLADEPVSAYAGPLVVRVRRWMRRHRTLVTSAAAVLVVATLSSILAAVLLTTKNRQLETAYAAEQAAKNEAQDNFKEASTRSRPRSSTSRTNSRTAPAPATSARSSPGAPPNA